MRGTLTRNQPPVGSWQKSNYNKLPNYNQLRASAQITIELRASAQITIELRASAQITMNYALQGKLLNTKPETRDPK